LLGRNHTLFLCFVYILPPISLYRNTMVGETRRVCTLKMSPLVAVFRNQSLPLQRNRGIPVLCTKNREKVIFLSKYSLDRNNIIFSVFHTQYTTDFFVADIWFAKHYLLVVLGSPLRSKDLQAICAGILSCYWYFLTIFQYSRIWFILSTSFH
jgi:hypothetical protein